MNALDELARRVPDFSPDRDWVSMHHASWLDVLGPFIGQTNVRGLEIGSMEGRSAVWFARHILTGPGAELVCVDTWNSDWSHAAEEARFDHNTNPWPILKRKGRSQDVLPQLLVHGERFDFVYVDGDHHAAVCLWDCLLGWELLDAGGVLIVDDYGWTGEHVGIPPRPAIDAFVRCFRDRTRKVRQTRCGQVVIWK